MTDKDRQTLHIRRIINAPPERVYKAFLDPDAMVKWLPPRGFTGKVTMSDMRVGGGYKMTFTNFSNGHSHSFGANFIELVPYSLIRYNNNFDDPNMPGTMEVTIEFRKTLNGTELTITQAGIPTQIPLEFATMGWQESLMQLELLVIPEIKE